MAELDPYENVNSVSDILLRAREYPLTDHPFFQRLAREPSNLQGLWSYYANLAEVTFKVPDWLAQILLSTKSLELKCFLSGLLHDELGRGNPEEIHCLLLEKLVDRLGPWKPQHSLKICLAPGKALNAAMSCLFENPLPNDLWAIGSLISGEIYAEQMITALSREVRRQREVDLGHFAWQIIHERIEGDHASCSDWMSQYVPTTGDAFQAVLEGARWKRESLWEWLTGLHEIAFSSPDRALNQENRFISEYVS